MKHHPLILLSCAPFIVAAALAADSPQQTDAARVTTLLTRALPDIEGKEVTMLTVEYPPGASSPPHRHDANTFVYVLEGSVIMQVDGGKEVTLEPGDTFYESPADVHRVSRNASATRPAKFLVFFVKNAGAATTSSVSR